MDCLVPPPIVLAPERVPKSRVHRLCLTVAVTRGRFCLRAKIKWRSDEDGHPVACDEEFRHAFAEAEQDAARRPLIVDVALDDGGCLSIGLGREVSVLSYVGASRKPPYFSSQGSARVRDSEGVVFHYYGHWSEGGFRRSSQHSW
jgi:hypothetical protein